MKDEYETNRYNEHDLWRFAIGDLVSLRPAPAQRDMYANYSSTRFISALVVDRRVDGGYVEARPIKYQTWEKYRIVSEGESRWLNAELLERSSTAS